MRLRSRRHSQLRWRLVVPRKLPADNDWRGWQRLLHWKTECPTTTNEGQHGVFIPAEVWIRLRPFFRVQNSVDRFRRPDRIDPSAAALISVDRAKPVLGPLSSSRIRSYPRFRCSSSNDRAPRRSCQEAAAVKSKKKKK